MDLQWLASVILASAYALCCTLQGLLYLLSSTTYPFLSCCLSQRLPFPLLLVPPSWDTAVLPACWLALSTGSACEKPLVTITAQSRWLHQDTAEVTWELLAESLSLTPCLICAWKASMVGSWEFMTPGKLFQTSFLEGRQESSRLLWGFLCWYLTARYMLLSCGENCFCKTSLAPTSVLIYTKLKAKTV